MRFASFVFAVIIIPALADEPLYCSTSFQGYRVCSGPDGYVSHESTWNGITTRDDNRGNHWTTSRGTPASPRSARSADVVDQIKVFAKTSDRPSPAWQRRLWAAFLRRPATRGHSSPCAR